MATVSKSRRTIIMSFLGLGEGDKGSLAFKEEELGGTERLSYRGNPQEPRIAGREKNPIR